MQAVPLPEAGEVTEDPGKLPEPDKVTKAYFEVSLPCHSTVLAFPQALRLFAADIVQATGHMFRFCPGICTGSQPAALEFVWGVCYSCLPPSFLRTCFVLL